MNHQGFVHLITKLGFYFWKIKWKFIVSSLTEFSEEIALHQFCRLSFFCFALWPPTKDLDLVDWKLIWDRRIVFEEIWFLSKETRKQCDQIFMPKNLSYLFIVPQVAESGVISKIAQNFTQFWPRYSKNNRQGNQYVAKWLKSRPNRYKSPNSVTLPAHKRKSRAQKGWRNWKLANWQIKLNVDANAFKEYQIWHHSNWTVSGTLTASFLVLSSSPQFAWQQNTDDRIWTKDFLFWRQLLCQLPPTT